MKNDMINKLLVDDYNLQVGKAKYLGKFVDTGFNLIDDNEIVIVSADHIVTNKDCTEEYYKLLKLTTEEIHDHEELDDFLDEYWTCIENSIGEEHSIAYEFKSSESEPFEYTIESEKIIREFEWRESKPGRKCKFIISAYKVMCQEDSEWDL